MTSSEWQPDEQDAWIEHPIYSSKDWMFDVTEGNTRHGYIDWVNMMIETANDHVEPELPIWKATVEIFVQANSISEVYDVIAESLRDHLPGYGNQTCWLDWHYPNGGTDLPDVVPATPEEIAELEAYSSGGE